MFYFYLLPLVPLLVEQLIPDLNLSALKRLVNFVSQDPIRDVCFSIPVYLTSADKFEYPDLAEASQTQLEYKLGTELPLQFTIFNNRAINDSVIEYEHLLDIEKYRLYEVRLVLGETEGIYTDKIENFAVLYYSLHAIAANDLPYFVTQLVKDNLFGKEIQMYQSGNMLGMPSFDDVFPIVSDGRVDDVVTRTFCFIDQAGEAQETLAYLEEHFDGLNAVFQNLARFELHQRLNDCDYKFIIDNHELTPRTNTTFVARHDGNHKLAFLSLVTQMYQREYMPFDTVVRTSFIKQMYEISNNLVEIHDVIRHARSVRLDDKTYTSVLTVFKLRQQAVDIINREDLPKKLFYYTQALNLAFLAKRYSENMLFQLKSRDIYL